MFANRTSQFGSRDRIDVEASSQQKRPGSAARAGGSSNKDAPNDRHAESTPNLPTTSTSSKGSVVTTQQQQQWASGGPLAGSQVGRPATSSHGQRGASRQASRGTDAADPDLHLQSSLPGTRSGSRGTSGPTGTAADGRPGSALPRASGSRPQSRGVADGGPAHHGMVSNSGSLSPTNEHDEFVLRDTPPKERKPGGGKGSPALGAALARSKRRGKNNAHIYGGNSLRSASTRSRPGTASRPNTASLRGAGVPGAVAGYVPPTDASRVDPRRLREAESLLRNEAGLEAMKEDPLFRLAALQVGIQPGELASLENETPDAYRVGPSTPRTTLEMRAQHAARYRSMDLALVLTQMDIAAEEHAMATMAGQAMTQSINADLNRHVKIEAAASERAARTRAHQQAVMAAEVEQERARREAWDAFVAAEAAKEAQAEEEAAADARMKLMVQQRKQENRTAVKERQQQREDDKALAALEAADAERAKEEARLQREEDDKVRKRFVANELRRRREGNRANADKEHSRRLGELQSRMADKEDKLRRRKARMAEEAAVREAQRWARDRQRRSNAGRIAREREYRAELLAQAQAARTQRIDVLLQLKDAFARERTLRQEAERNAQEKLKCAAADRHSTPGPGEYKQPSFTDPLVAGKGRGVVWNEGGGRLAHLERTAKEARDMPGPGTYVLNDKAVRSTAKLAVISGSRTKSHLDAAAAAAADTPGPGEYAPTEARVTSRVNPRRVVMGSSSASYLDGVARRAKETPGPGGSHVPSPVKGGNASRPPSVKALTRAVQSGELFHTQRSLGGGVVSQEELEPLLAATLAATGAGGGAAANEGAPPAFTPVMRGSVKPKLAPIARPASRGEDSSELPTVKPADTAAEAAAATRIQASVRGKQARKEAASTKASREQSAAEAAAATRIQASVRGKQARTTVAKRKEELEWGGLRY